MIPTQYTCRWMLLCEFPEEHREAIGSARAKELSRLTAQEIAVWDHILNAYGYEFIGPYEGLQLMRTITRATTTSHEGLITWGDEIEYFRLDPPQEYRSVLHYTNLDPVRLLPRRD